MHIKKNDNVKILAGKDNGKTGKVLQVLPKEGKVSIEGLNLLVKHMRPNREGEKGQRIEFPAFINVSNVALICPSCGRQTRVSAKVVEGEKGTKKYRACKKCQAVIE
ncbi:50S ribosomal protein L24 [Candidatus Falkowbacteria bacterium HGW-Falkowbacteria-2]|uniref:Large ribosomal subunit protein uL24 n=1 Tax=Candidatus Falkowbacteria bacterium HGW-Falkowbacteria-2 TaxID=2013769 RepID=A0A2N2E321_9BACT|nr:MAG: 50S ribosomal protein L24 [Candidatus Falkowbacteria bacterium HGW-Falkowbacteria-2]